MLKETFDKATGLNKQIMMMEFMKNKIAFNGLMEIFSSALVTNYRDELDLQFKNEILEMVGSKLERLKQEFELL